MKSVNPISDGKRLDKVTQNPHTQKRRVGHPRSSNLHSRKTKSHPGEWGAIHNKQRKMTIDRWALELFLGQIKREMGIGDAEVAISLVSDREIARMNQQFRKKVGPTDVLSFSAIERTRPVPLVKEKTTKTKRRDTEGAEIRGDLRTKLENGAETPREFLGDIAIAPGIARKYAKRNGRSLNAELRVLILHGILHLLGYDHEMDEGQMDRIERRLRRRFGLA